MEAVRPTTSTTLNHKEMTAHIRSRITKAGIKARVKMQDGCYGNKVIYVSSVAFDRYFTEDEQREIRHIAKCNQLTFACGQEIEVDQMTNPSDFRFYFWGRSK